MSKVRITFQISFLPVLGKTFRIKFFDKKYFMTHLAVNRP